MGSNRVAVIQMVSTESLSDNLEQLRRLLRPLPEQGVQLVVLPENFAAYGNPDYRKIAEREALAGADTVTAQLANLAKELKLWIVAGTLPILGDDDDRPWAACLVFSDQGEIVARYHKIHLFDALVNDSQARYQESQHYRPGETVSVVDTPVGRLGLTVCYDLRFPELFGKLRDMGAELIAVPSAFTWVTGNAHWQPLLQARAIETGCYILAAGQGGQHNAKRRTWGHSQIIDPWGTVINELDEGPGVVTAGVDLTKLQEIRQQLPVFEHRQARKQRLDW